MVGVSTGAAVVYAVAAFAVVLTPLAITLLKGHRLLAVIGFFVGGVIWFVAAFRLARPDSYWAKRYYSDDKMRRARLRYRVAPDAAV